MQFHRLECGSTSSIFIIFSCGQVPECKLSCDYYFQLITVCRPKRKTAEMSQICLTARFIYKRVYSFITTIDQWPLKAMHFAHHDVRKVDICGNWDCC